MKIFVCFCICTGFALGAMGAHAASTAAPATTNDAALTVSAKDRAEGNDYWRKLGVTPPRGGFILKHPWSPPWSGRSLIVPAAWFAHSHEQERQHVRDKTPMMVNAAALRADLPTLHLVLEKNYSGWETAAKHGWDWDGWFRHWDAMLAGYGQASVPDAKAFAPWFAYEQFQIDSHSGPAIPSRLGNLVMSRDAVLQSVPKGTCTALRTSDGKRYALNHGDPAQQPHAVESWDGTTLHPSTYIVYPSSFGTVTQVVCDGHEIAAVPFWDGYSGFFKPAAATKASIAALGDGMQGLAYYNTLAPGIGYLRLAAFNDAGDEALVKLIPKLPASAGHEKVLVVDLRGNDGGSAPVDQLARWIPLDKIHGRLTQIGKRSCLYPGLWFNLGQVLSLGVKRPVTEAFRQLAKGYMRNIDAPVTDACPVTFKTTRGYWYYSMHHFVPAWHGSRPRLLVLTDGLCGSDCEAMAWILAQLPGTVIAGSNTFGVIGFTQPGVLLLPHTRIAFQLATSRTDSYGDDRSVNGYGLDVDVTLPTAADWSRDSILALARQLEGNPDRPARH